MESPFTDDIAGRLDQVESRLAIQELAARYALAVDSRDVDAWLDLFVPDVDCGRFGKGRDALRQSIEPSLRNFYRSVHLVCGHVIDFESCDRARGTVYCRAEHEDGGQWVVVPLIYFDSYVRRGGRWYFAKRGNRTWYSADVLDRPGTNGFHHWRTTTTRPPALPGAFPSWSAFWDRAEPGTVDALTSSPLPSGDS